jgi:hypothetical protein
MNRPKIVSVGKGQKTFLFSWPWYFEALSIDLTDQLNEEIL